MSNLIKSEIYKLSRDRSFWLVSAILIAFAMFMPIFLFFDHGAQSTTGIKVYLTALSGNNYIIKLAPCILAGFFISSEYSRGTMKSMAATGNRRGRIYFAKLLVFSLGAIVISTIYPIINGLVGSLLFSFGNIPHVSNLGYLAQTLGLFILFAGAFASIMAFFAIILTDSGKTIGLLLIFFFIFGDLLQTLSEKFPIFNPVYNYSVFNLLSDISKVNIGSGELFKLIIVPILTFVGFGFLGYVVYRRKEIK